MQAPGPRVVWICGAPGAGKSAAAWALYERLAHAGTKAAHVDIDQLGMLYPEADEQRRHLLKAEALAALLPGYASAGAEVVVVSGVIDADTGPTALKKLGVTMCLLRAGEAALRARIVARGWDEEDVAEAILEEKRLQGAGFVDATIDTVGLSVSETVNRLSAMVSTELSPTGNLRPPDRTAVPTDILMITGPRAAGSSTIGFGLASKQWREGRRTAFLDVQQLGFLAGGGSTGEEAAALGMLQLATMHAHMSAHGAGLVMVSGHLSASDRPALRAALEPSPLTLVRLRADRATLEAHVRARVAGSEARLAGDDLLGAGLERQSAVIAAALAEQVALDATGGDDGVVDVSGRTAAEVIEEISVRWLPSAR